MLRFCAPLPEDFVNVCSEADIPLGEYERFGGLSKSESGREEDFEHVTEIPEMNGYWIPQPYIEYKQSQNKVHTSIQ